MPGKGAELLPVKPLPDALRGILRVKDSRVYTGKPILDENGKLQLREKYYLDSVECNPFSFAMECWELNARFHKKQKYDEIKSHHYIISLCKNDVERQDLMARKQERVDISRPSKLVFP